MNDMLQFHLHLEYAANSEDAPSRTQLRLFQKPMKSSPDALSGAVPRICKYQEACNYT